ncbi:response regulator, partial [Rhizobium phaseoli]
EFDRASSVTTSTNQSYRRAYVPVPSAVERREPAAMEAIVPENFSGRKILVVTADLAAEAAALRTLAKYGFESCSVRGEDEEERFLEIATSSGISLDLLIIDNQMGMRCLELAEQYGIPSLVMDGFQIANELTFQIARHFNRNSRNNGAGTDSDWEISISDDTIGLQVLVAEDNDINQIVFTQILEGLGYRHMIAATGDEVVRLWAEHRPQVVLMDINMPKLSGIDAIELFRSELPQTRVVMLSMHDSREYISSSVMRGAAGYVLKDVSTEEIVAAIETVADGGTYFSSGVFDALMRERAEEGSDPLTPREHDTLGLIVAGRSNREIAEVLGISAATAETHRKNLKKKLGIATTAGLIRYALDHGIASKIDANSHLPTSG